MTQAETYTTSRWSLEDLFPSHSGPEFQAAMQEIDQRANDFAQRREELSPDISAERFNELIDEQTQIAALASRLGYYANLWFTEDTQNQEALTLLARIQQQMATLFNKTMFFSLWWKDLDDQNAQRLLEGSGDVRYWLEHMRLAKPHTLTEAEEKIINIKDVTGFSAITNLYDALTNRYLFKLTIDGEERELTRGELAIYQRHHTPEMRAAAYQTILNTYANDGHILGQMYQTLVRDWHNEQIDLRGYATPMSARNLGNDIPDEVVDTLLDVCKQNVHIFHRFFKLKARLTGVERLRRYDVYAPIAKSERDYSFDKAATMVFDAFERFDPQLATLARRVFEERHLDSEVRKGKRSGAFCASPAPTMTPYVQVNYQGRAEDVATLAHELGHAIHSMLSEKHHHFTWHSSLPLAETASTFGEMMLIDQVLETEEDEGVRRDLLFKQLDDAYATIQRQAFFALFERQAHQMTAEGASVDDLAAAYLENLREQFGDSIEVSEDFKWEWVSIPHIYHTPFYVYAYTFGQLLVLALYQQYQEEGEPFKQRYIKILSAGGSAAPADILRDAGIDIRSAEFWQGGFDVLSKLVDRLEQL